MTAKEMWEFDKLKINTAENHGYTIMVIWEDVKNKENTIKKCIEFLYD